jgi:hypothetical protein
MSNPTQDNASEPRNVSYPTTANFYGNQTRNTVPKMNPVRFGLSLKNERCVGGEPWPASAGLSFEGDGPVHVDGRGEYRQVAGAACSGRLNEKKPGRNAPA